MELARRKEVTTTVGNNTDGRSDAIGSHFTAASADSHNTISDSTAEIAIQAQAIHGNVTVIRTAAAVAPTALRQLPPRIPGFAGRAEDLATVVSLLGPDTAATPVIVSAVAGLAGIGKTALAIHAAHTAVDAGLFPGGVLFVDMRGYSDPPIQAPQALDSLLRALGVPGQHIPPELDARSGLYRSQLAHHDGAVLVVVDNASTAEQVLPLLPGDTRHRVLVTSRHTLRLNARLHDLNILGQQAAIDLLDAALRTANPQDTRINADADLAAQVARLCGRLPLALQIAAALLITDPAKTLAELIDELIDENSRLAVLNDGERAVRTAFDLSYRRLRPDHAHLFRLLALNPGPDWAIGATAVLVQESPQRVRRMLAELLRAHMVQRTPISNRWTMHDLIRDYARSLINHDPESDRQQRTNQLLGYYLHAARAADRHLGAGRDGGHSVQEQSEDNVARILPALSSRRDALAWMEDEHLNLQASVAHAAATGNAALATGIAHAMANFLLSTGYWHQAVSIHRMAAVAAETAGDRFGEANALTDLGAAQRLTDNYKTAIETLTRALQLYQEFDDRLGLANAFTELGAAQRLTGEYLTAIGSLSHALQLHREFDDPLGRASTLSSLGAAQRLTGNLRAAVDNLTQALQLYRELEDQLGQASVLNVLGAVQREMGEYQAAVDNLTHALQLYRQLDDRFGQATALNHLGAVQWLNGDLPTAIETLTGALRLHEGLDSQIGQAHVLTFLGAVQRQSQTYALAEESLDRALSLYRKLGDRGGEVEALNHYAELVAATGDPSRARTLHLTALDLAREIRSRWDEANSLHGIAATYRIEGNPIDAKNCLYQALELYQSMGCAADAANVQAELGTAEHPDSPR